MNAERLAKLGNNMKRGKERITKAENLTEILNNSSIVRKQNERKTLPWASCTGNAQNKKL